MCQTWLTSCLCAVQTPNVQKNDKSCVYTTSPVGLSLGVAFRSESTCSKQSALVLTAVLQQHMKVLRLGQQSLDVPPLLQLL